MWNYFKSSVALTITLILFSLVHSLCAKESKNEGASEEVVMLSYNIRNGRGMDNKTDYQRIADVIKKEKATIVAVQEVDNKTKRSKGVDVLSVLGKETGMVPTYARAIHYDGGEYGVGLLSKETPLMIMRFRLPGREEKRVLLMVEFERYCVFVTHLSLTSEDRLESLNIIAKKARMMTKPVFIMGDFNFTPQSEEMKRLEKDFRVLNDVKQNTFPASSPKECIDYIAYYKGGDKKIPNVSKKEVVNEPMASDHRPVKVVARVKGIRKPVGLNIVVPGCRG